MTTVLNILDISIFSSHYTTIALEQVTMSKSIKDRFQ